jgi:hypothetical protein
MLPEQEHAHVPHRSGHRLADRAIAYAALVISLCSLGLALHHAHTMRQLVEANSRPFLQFSSSNGEVHEAEGVPALTVLISNPGAGAALIEKFAVLVDGKRVRHWQEAFTLLDPRATPAALAGMTYSDVAPSYLKAGSDLVALRWPRTEANAALWDDIYRRGRAHVEFEACYCSIFDECWLERSRVFRPEPVKSCQE